MDKLRRAIQHNTSWNSLVDEIDEVDRMRTKDLAKTLELAKSIVESIGIKIGKDRGIIFEDNQNTGKILKGAFEVLPVIRFLEDKDKESVKAILGSFSAIGNQIGQLRNKYGPIGHGKDIHSAQIDAHVLLFSIESCDLIASYLITLDAYDESERTRVEYDDNLLFNNKIDDEQDEELSVKGILLSPSKALYGADIELYKELLIEFDAEKKENLTRLQDSKNFVETREICSNLHTLKDYLSDDELRLICSSFIENPQIYRIVGHGYTKMLHEWIIQEKSTILEESQMHEMKYLKSKSLY